MKTKTKIIIALVIIFIIFISAFIIIAVNKLNTSDDTSNSDVSSSETLSSSNINDDSIISSTSTPQILNSEPNEDDNQYFPGYERPEIEITAGNIDFVGINNLTLEQSEEEAMGKLSYLLDNAALKKDIDYAKILDSSTKEKVAIEVHFKNGRIIEYVAMFDILNSHNFIRCMDKESYEEILNGAFV